MSLTGQVALVTGAGSAEGIGFAIAARLAADGATVVISSTTERVHQRVAELRSAGGQAIGVVHDLMRPGAAAALVEAAVAVKGHLDICVNNAGMVAIGDSLADATLDDTTDDAWHAALERNLTTCFAVTRAVVPHMRANGYGRVVNIASTSGAVQAFVGDVGYHAAKAGMVGFTRAVALETAAAGITVNAVAPGWIHTASSSEVEHRAAALSPVGRPGRPEEVAAAVRFLVDPLAGFTTGQLIVVDGGNSLPEDRAWRP
ncbi:MAG TPA: SDR family NAD(P)-dependent oxidoreductase [Ilumatobacteraceae bacterium]|nr:SDR family NAD(P)-dependent oxidoreductase [Ilumatobacteraceae bacterium]